MRHGHNVQVDLPKALVLSQLPGATFPLDITVRFMEHQDIAGGGAALSSTW